MTPRSWIPARRRLLIVALLGLIAVCAYRAGREFWADYHFRAAQSAMQRGAHAEARVELLRCLSVRPDDPDIHFLLARTARRAGAATEAESHRRDSERLGAVAAQVELERQLEAVAAGAAGPDEILLWAFADKGHPDAAYILEALAQGGLATFRLDRAAAAAQQWAKLQPENPQAWLVRGKALYHMHGYQEAAECYGRAVALAPDDDEARRLYAGSLLENAQPAEALAQYEELLRQKAGDVAAQLGRARALLGLARLAEAGQALAAARRAAAPALEALVLAGKVELQQGHAEQAEPPLRQAVAQSPFDREAVYTLAQCLQQQGKQSDAEEWLRRLKRIDADQARLAEITKQILASPHDAALRSQAGAIFLSIGNEPEGLRWLESALHEDPHHAPTHQLLSEYYQAHGQPDRAEHHRRAAVRRDP